MNSYTPSSIQTLIENLKLDTTPVKKSSERMNGNIYANMNRVLNESTIGYIEWNLSENIMYLSDLSLEYCGVSEEKLTFSELISNVFDEDAMLKYLNALQELELGLVERIEIEVGINSSIHNEIREVKIVFFNIESENGMDQVIACTIKDTTNSIQDIQYVNRLLKANKFLLEVGELIDDGIDMSSLYNAILKGILEIIPNAYKGCILLLDFNNNIYIKESIGYDDVYANKFRIPFYTSFASMVLSGNYRKSVFINNIQEQYGDLFPDVDSESRGFRLQSNMTSPINVDGKLYGLISIDSANINGFDETDLNMIDFLRAKIELSINRFKELSQVIEKSNRDELTGTFNRRFFKTIMESLISESTLNKETFCLVVFDIDELKIVNDTYGHLAGDELLKNFTKLMIENMREEDVLARIGGDEFVGLYRNIDTIRLSKKMENISDLIKNHPIDFNGETIVTKFSYGMAQFPIDGERDNDLIALADERMYTSKVKKKT